MILWQCRTDQCLMDPFQLVLLCPQWFNLYRYDCVIKLTKTAAIKRWNWKMKMKCKHLWNSKLIQSHWQFPTKCNVMVKHTVDTYTLWTHTLQVPFLCIYSSSLTFQFEVHASKDEWADELGLHLSLKVDEDGGQVAVWVVGDAGGWYGLEKLGLRELPGQCVHVLVDEGTQRDAVKGETR